MERGTFYNIGDNWNILDTSIENCPIIKHKENGSILCYIRPNAISKELCDLAVESYLDAGKMVSTNRGVAAGISHRNKVAHYERGIEANSAIIGYIDSTNHKRPCRLTAYSKTYFDKYTGGLPFIKCINDCYKDSAPEEYEKQRIFSQLSKDFLIADTVFSTVTVNYNFRTALHKDSGDYKAGYGSLVICSKDIEGGLILFPEYKVAIKPNNGDYIMMDVHEYHCNSEIIVKKDGGYRLAFVCYLREKMWKCNEINRNLADLGSLNGELWDTEILFKKIFGEELPEKKVDGKWWTMSDDKFCLSYKNKRYTLFDKINNKKVQNLIPAWRYIEEYF
jgi:hypothetical protein